MTPEKFEEVVEARKGCISRVLGTKAAEYARGGDRLHNFHRSAAFAQMSPEKVCWMFLMKHLTSIADLVDNAEQGKPTTEAMADEKIGDAINYLILLEAIMKERRDSPECPF
jgi:hypothetical protein